MSRTYYHASIDLRDGTTAGKGHRQFKLGKQVSNDFLHARLTSHGKTVYIRPSDAHCRSAQSQCLENISTATNATVKKDGHFTLNG